MSQKIPLVLGPGGAPEELQAGDRLLALVDTPPGEADVAMFTFQAVNLGFATIPRGGVCAIHPAGTGVIPAEARLALAAGVGMAQTALLPGVTPGGFIQTGGIFSMVDWSAIIGSVQLWPRGVYFLDPANPGKLTRVPPTTFGDYSQVVGLSMNPADMQLVFQLPILL